MRPVHRRAPPRAAGRRRTRGVPLLAVLFAVAASPCLSDELQPIAEVEVVAVVPRSFPPEYVTNAQGRPGGFAIDSIETVAALAGIKVRYRVEETWPDTLAALEDGHADLIPNLGVSAERSVRFAFTRPLGTFPISIFVRTASEDLDHPLDLAGKSVAVVRENVAAIILARRPDVETVLMDNVEAALFKLLSGEVDALAYPAPALRALAKEAGLDQRIRTTGAPLAEVKRAIAVRRNDEALYATLAPAVERFLDSGAYRRIYTRWYRDPDSPWSATRLAWAMGGLLFLAFVAMGLWRYFSVAGLNRRLNEYSRDWSRAEESRRQANLILENSPVVLFKWGPRGDWPVELVSRNVTRFGYSAEDLTSGSVSFASIVHPDDVERVRREVREYSELGHSTFRQEYRIVTPSGEMRWVDDRTTIERDASGEIRSYQGVLIDVTDLRQAELQLRHAQKMDAVGAMASGIAHDFNNVLTVVVGNLGALRRQLAGNAQALSRIDSIEKSARRAIELTRKLLEFSRQDPMPSVHVDINDRIRNMSGLINRSLTPEVRVVYQLSGDLWPTEIDPGDFESAVLNLVLNARDAMTGGGQLIIATANVAAGNSAVEAHGDMVELTIADDGSGMDAATRERIFEPFFTTKPRGKGTGLGLAMVFGFVRRSRGRVEVTSAPGAGTTFRLAFPRAAGDANAQSVVHDVVLPSADSPSPGVTTHAPLPPRPAADCTPTILVVDDEPDLRDLVEETLSEHGYRVLTAGDGHEAIAVLSRGEPVDLLFSDVVMPGGMSGFELAGKAQEYRAGLKILLTSGHYEAGIGTGTDFIGEVLIKPYTDTELLWRLNALLGTDESGDARYS